MKKVISIVLAIAVLATFGITAFAETVTTVPGTSEGTVNVIIDEESKANIDDVYYVDVEWDSLDFTYSFSDDATNEWDPSTHTYGASDYTGANWNGKTTATITVTNHSNKDVSVAAEMENPVKNGVTTTLDKTEFDLVTGEGLTYDTADNEVITVSVKGVPTVRDTFEIDVITLTISAK